MMNAHPAGTGCIGAIPTIVIHIIGYGTVDLNKTEIGSIVSGAISIMSLQSTSCFGIGSGTGGAATCRSPVSEIKHPGIIIRSGRITAIIVAVVSQQHIRGTIQASVVYKRTGTIKPI